ncbi:hypothetical protein F4678DRAFT_442292 [Xylaria arbuscula]|nr:hypothetical protein F4678DRAFT_442292 [Xylaria arbuscula]
MEDIANHAPVALEPKAPRQPRQRQDRTATRPQNIPFHQLYALPAPIRTVPLPSFYPNNPLSLFHVLWAWASQLVSPPPAEPSVIHQGHWSPMTRSVHIRDPKSIRALWEQGFFGKGCYSRSEPNWLKREQNRQGQGEKKVSELVTVQRREERKMMKWERARKEQEAILKTRLEEAWVAPVGPKELLALPNSHQDLLSSAGLVNGHALSNNLPPSTEPHTPITYAPGVSRGQLTPPTPKPAVNGDRINEGSNIPFPSLNGTHLPSPPETPVPKSVKPLPDNGASTLKRRKSVRFSPTVDSTTFQLGDPPSPHPKSSSNGSAPNGTVVNGSVPLPQPVETIPTEVSDVPAAPTEIIDREHLQLTLEETFYLAYGLGALTVIDPTTEKPISTQDLFQLCRQMYSFSPTPAVLGPDDPFLIQYAVYHHFRSLGWVPRPGIKFGVDWLLYIGGPVFSHAEFAVNVLPAYTEPYWKAQGREAPRKSWHWLHSINRVQSHALKTLVLVYVDIPPPTEATDPSTILKRFKIREFVMKRWLSNRSRN